MPSKYKTHTLGLPRIGRHRELKKATEAYWAGHLSREDLQNCGSALRHEMWKTQSVAGIALPSCNDFSFYDRMLDMTCMLGAIPRRFAHTGWHPLDLQFAMARGVGSGAEARPACEMTKWFDTNYHYIVPELDEQTQFALTICKPADEFAEALRLGYHTKPILIGPVTYLLLAKASSTASSAFSPLALLDKLLPVYQEILGRLASAGAEWVQFDEPIFSMDLEPAAQEALLKSYVYLAAAVPNIKLLVANYFGGLQDNLETFVNLPVHGLHADLCRAPQELPSLLDALRSTDKVLSLGVIDGRNIWRSHFAKILPLLREAKLHIPAQRLWLAPSCSLQHVPWSLEEEKNLDGELKSWLSFALEKMYEIAFLADWLEGAYTAQDLADNQRAAASRQASVRIHNEKVTQRIAKIPPKDYQRNLPFAKRQPLQKKNLGLPVLPTTTIGSFPQTTVVRKARADWKKAALSDGDYTEFLRKETARCIAIQEELGLDMLVHGEFERNDMVEYFGEQLQGFAFTGNGWVQSYGSRCVKPPIIFGDVSRPSAMTVEWSRYAQSLTAKPMKGMLTGPITILQWSFVRDDQPRADTATQIALALRDEVADLENAGICAIQIDEPALREGLPLRRKDWNRYLDWAVGAFRLCSSGVGDATQIHTHMCYAEFNDIMEAIAALDADVITMEASRSGNELLESFLRFQYPNEIGPGVYDIHSPIVPSVNDFMAAMHAALQLLPLNNLWVNPDCGLKTRGWPETIASLRNMVEATRNLRAMLVENASTSSR